MAEEEQKILIDIDYKSVEEYANATIAAKEKIDNLRKANDELKASGKATDAQIAAGNAAIKAAEKEYKNTTATLQKMITANKETGTSYDSLYKQWQAAERKLKSMSGTIKQNADGTYVLTDAYKKAAKESAAAKDALNKFSTSANDGRNNVGLYTQSVKEALKQTGLFGRLNITGVMVALGAAVAGVWSQFKSTIAYTKEFEKELSTLKSLTGASSSDISFYRDAAKQLGDQFGVTGKDMVEAFKIVGSAKSELLKSKEGLVSVTEAAVTLSKAAGMDVPAAADALTVAMNQFSAHADEAGRYVNVLASGAKEGAAEIPDLSDSLIKFGAVAASSNVSIEQSVALIEALAEKGIKGEVAGTGIKSFLLKLEQGAKETRPSVVGLNKALENLKAQNLSNADVTKRFGLETANVALTLINQTDRVKELTSAVGGTNEAYKQAAINQDNIAGATDRLSAKWTNFKEALLNGKGAFASFLKGQLNDISDVLEGFESLLKSKYHIQLEKVDRENKNALTSYQEMLKVAHDRLTIEADLAEFARNRAGWEKKLSDVKKNQDAIEISKAEKKIQLYDSLINLAQKQKDINEGKFNGKTEQDQSKKDKKILRNIPEEI